MSRPTWASSVSEVCADLSTAGVPNVLVCAAVAKFGRTDILVNNADIVPIAPFREADPVIWDKVMNLNTR